MPQYIKSEMGFLLERGEYIIKFQQAVMSQDVGQITCVLGLRLALESGSRTVCCLVLSPSSPVISLSPWLCL